ncbi:putative F-box protein At5g42430 [Rhododendron vialii]|uniref:putative F-box protein At5g42430 n=1 Tax=Rhododendron vialii TaxID=182163 RepID=UPI00265EA94F|nr:putative F-box protein At5g42430 [Rhododendron vialii]
MSLECLTWIPHLWDKLICALNVRKDSFAMQDFPKEILICSLNVRKDGFSMQDLPEEILVDILSRLPGNCVLERRRVCKQWLALTSTPNFLEMHLKRATPVLFVQFVDHVGKMDMFIFDEGAKVNQMIKKMGAEFMHLEASHVPDLCGSCNGLLLFRSIIPSSLCLVCNPLTGEKVTIRTPVHPVIVCGIFFHPLTNDYKLLFVYYKVPFTSRESVDIKYFLYNLRGQCWRKLDDFPYLPSVVAPPAILNGAVHWMVNCSLNDIARGSVGFVTSIMMFNMDTEEFRCMPHPRLECPVWKVVKYIRLFEMKGKLAFCRVHSSHVYLWVLEDYENWIWGERYSVNLHSYVKRYPLDITHIGPRYTGSLITVVDIQNDELLFDYRSRGLFRYNLRQKTIKQINGVGMKQMPLLPFSDSKRYIMSYTKTFVSPSGFK